MGGLGFLGSWLEEGSFFCEMCCYDLMCWHALGMVEFLFLMRFMNDYRLDEFVRQLKRNLK